MSENPVTEPFAEAGVATVEGGIVFLDGPDGIAVSFTPQAALATGRSLVEAGEAALRSGDNVAGG